MTFNIWTFLFQIVNFVVLAYLLHRLLYRPLQNAIERRRQQAAGAQAEAEKARQEAEAVRRQLEEQLAGLERRRQEVLREAHEQAGENRRKLLEEAERDLRQRHEEACRALERERDEAIEDLQGEVLEQALALARRLLSEAADQALDQQLARRLAQTLQRLPAAEKEQVRQQCLVGDDALLETFGPLDEATLAEVSEAVREVLGRKAQLRVQRKPALLAGVRVRLGGRVWDSSLAGQLPPSAELLSRGGAA